MDNPYCDCSMSLCYHNSVEWKMKNYFDFLVNNKNNASMPENKTASVEVM